MDGDADVLVGDLRARGAELLVVSDRSELTAQAHTPLPIPRLPEWLSPMTAVVPGQLLGHHLAVAKGLDPVQPRGLRKVTETR
jgi:glucosamine--fructose-6-phosphate aminotransferase (isomerizing)